MTILAWGEKCLSASGKKGVKSNKKIEEKKEGKENFVYRIFGSTGTYFMTKGS